MSKPGESLREYYENQIIPIKLTRTEKEHLRRSKLGAAQAAEHGISFDRLAEAQAFANNHPELMHLLVWNQAMRNLADESE